MPTPARLLDSPRTFHRYLQLAYSLDDLSCTITISTARPHIHEPRVHTRKLRTLGLEVVPLIALRVAADDQFERGAVLAGLLARDDVLQVVRRCLTTLEDVLRPMCYGHDLCNTS